MILCYRVDTMMQARKIGIREFRENLAMLLESRDPVAITRHGSTVGFYIPAKETGVQQLDSRSPLSDLIASTMASDQSRTELAASSRRGSRRQRKPRGA